MKKSAVGFCAICQKKFFVPHANHYAIHKGGLYETVFANMQFPFLGPLPVDRVSESAQKIILDKRVAKFEDRKI